MLSAQTYEVRVVLDDSNLSDKKFIVESRIVGGSQPAGTFITDYTMSIQFPVSANVDLGNIDNSAGYMMQKSGGITVNPSDPTLEYQGFGIISFFPSSETWNDGVWYDIFSIPFDAPNDSPSDVATIVPDGVLGGSQPNISPNGIPNLMTISGAGASLPITVSQFTAEKINERSARLFWETTSEVNSDYFIIQRSTDTENWESLGRVDAIGTPTSTQSYEFIDNTIPTTLRSEDNIFFYRLAMVDLDEQYELSAIRTLSFEGTSGIINIYPNPTAQNLIVDLTSVEGNSKIQLIDIQGRLIFEQKVTDEYNDIPVLNLRDMGLDNGTYLIRITEDSNRKVHTKKFLFID
jgi:hypothetical protein